MKNRLLVVGLKKAIVNIPTKNFFVALKLLFNIFLRIINRNNPKKLDIVFESKHQIIRKWLDNLLSKEIYNEIEKIENNKSNIAKELDSSQIWVMWWQGEGFLPPVVKLCIENLRKFNPQYNIILIHQDNVKEYTNLPNIIFDRFHNGKISIQLLSDVVRFNLLKEQGGLWIDSTMLTTSSLNLIFSNYSFFSLKRKQENNFYVSKYKWDCSYLYSKNHSKYMTFISNILTYFASKYNTALEYFIVDYIVDILKRKNKDFEQIIESYPIINTQTDLLCEIANEACNKELIDELIRNNFVFKFNHRNEYKENTVDGKLSNWGYLKTLI